MRILLVLILAQTCTLPAEPEPEAVPVDATVEECLLVSVCETPHGRTTDARKTEEPPDGT